VIKQPNFVFDDSPSSSIGSAVLLRRSDVESPRHQYSTTPCRQAPAAATLRCLWSPSLIPGCARRRAVVKHCLGQLLTTRAMALSLDGTIRMASSTPDSGCFLAGDHRAPSLAGLCDTMSSSTALTVFSDSASSSMGWRRFFLLGVVKRRGKACLTTRCRRARFFVTYDALGFSPAPLAPNAFALRFAWPSGDTTPPTPRPGEAPTPRWTDRVPRWPDEGFPSRALECIGGHPHGIQPIAPRVPRSTALAGVCLVPWEPRDGPADPHRPPPGWHQAYPPFQASPAIRTSCGTLPSQR
jgi:hypothetical protein